MLRFLRGAGIGPVLRRVVRLGVGLIAVGVVVKNVVSCMEGSFIGVISIIPILLIDRFACLGGVGLALKSCIVLYARSKGET
jgi:hypothetical protein